MGALMNCHEPPCGMGREDSRPGTGHPGGHTGHPGGMPAGPRTLEDGSPLCRLIAWEVTRSCNLACKHCRAEAHPEPYPGELSTEEAKALIDTFPSVGNPIIIFTGGDPMIRPDVYEQRCTPASLILRAFSGVMSVPLGDITQRRPLEPA